MTCAEIEPVTDGITYRFKQILLLKIPFLLYLHSLLLLRSRSCPLLRLLLPLERPLKRFGVDHRKYIVAQHADNDNRGNPRRQ